MDYAKNKNLTLTQSPYSYLKGFTLVEILVAAGIFVVVIGITVATFTTSNCLQSQTVVLRETSQSGRYILETIARDIRLANDTVGRDGKRIPAFEVGGNSLTIHTKDEQGNDVGRIYEFYDDPEIEGRQTIMVSEDKGSSYSDLISPNISISKVEGKDIFEEIGGSDPTQQNKLAINLQVNHLEEGRRAEQANQVLQTTVTTRSYPGFE